MIVRTRSGGTFLYFMLIILASALGILSRKFPGAFPSFLASYAGDAMWSFALYFLLGILFYRLRIRWKALLAFALSLAVEFSQLLQLHWLNMIRNTTIGGLILGFGFLPEDILCYLAGILLGAVLEGLFLKKI